MFRVLIGLALALALSLLVVVFAFRMEEVVMARGKVEPACDFELSALVDGKIAAIHKKEGDRVAKGEVIIEFDTRDFAEEMRDLEAEIGEGMAELDLRRNALDITKSDPLPKEYRHATIILRQQAACLEKSEEKLLRSRGLHERNVISKAALEKIEVEHYGVQAAYEQAKEIHDQVTAGLDLRYLRKDENEIRLLETKLANKKVRLESLRRHIEDYRIVAPEPGKITRLDLAVGVYLEKGAPAVRITIMDTKRIVALVDEKDIRGIEPGQAARINSHVYNRLHFGYFHGKVTRIKDVPVELTGRPFYPVEVEVVDKRHDLRLGSSIELSIVTGKDRVINVLLGMKY